MRNRVVLKGGNVMEFLLLLLTGLLLYQVKKYKIYKTSTMIMYWLTMDTFVVPIVYYSYMEGGAYRRFNEDSYCIYMSLGTVYILCMILFTWIFNRKKRLKYIIVFPSCFLKCCIKNLVSVSTGLIFTVTFVWIFMIRSHLPIFAILQGTYGIIRPDTSGAIAHYIILQTLMMIIVPTLILYYIERKKWGKMKKNIGFILIFVLLIAGGNQGVAAYFVIFLWMYEWKYRVNFKLVSIAVCSFLSYFTIKSANPLSDQNPVHILESAIRRLLITQPAMLINRISMIEEEYFFLPNKISETVFEYVYDTKGGSAPSFYLGDFIVVFGYVGGTILAILTLFLIMYYGKSIDSVAVGTKLYKKWYVFIGLFLIGMSGPSVSNLLRFVAVLLTICVICFDSKHRKQAMQSDEGNAKNKNLYVTYVKSGNAHL